MKVVRPAGFEPASEAWKASILTRLDYGRSHRKSIVSGYDLRVLIEWTKLDRLVEGFDPIRNQCAPNFLPEHLSYLTDCQTPPGQ